VDVGVTRRKGGRRALSRQAAATPRRRSRRKVARWRNAPSPFLARGWEELSFPGKRWQCLVLDGIAWQDLCV